MFELDKYYAKPSEFEEAIHLILFDREHAPQEREAELEDELRAMYHRLKELDKRFVSIRVDYEKEAEVGLWIGVHCKDQKITLLLHVAEDLPMSEVFVTHHDRHEIRRIKSFFGEPVWSDYKLYESDQPYALIKRLSVEASAA